MRCANADSFYRRRNDKTAARTDACGNKAQQRDGTAKNVCGENNLRCGNSQGQLLARKPEAQRRNPGGIIKIHPYALEFHIHLYYAVLCNYNTVR